MLELPKFVLTPFYLQIMLLLILQEVVVLVVRMLIKVSSFPHSLFSHLHIDHVCQFLMCLIIVLTFIYICILFLLFLHSEFNEWRASFRSQSLNSMYFSLFLIFILILLD